MIHEYEYLKFPEITSNNGRFFKVIAHYLPIAITLNGGFRISHNSEFDNEYIYLISIAS